MLVLVGNSLIILDMKSHENSKLEGGGGHWLERKRECAHTLHSQTPHYSTLFHQVSVTQDMGRDREENQEPWIQF